jgi:asparagine synthase (glutamine-hydrolysing)
MSIGKSLPADAALLISGMNACLQHRGPDDAGVCTDLDKGVVLGHRRLSIIDLSTDAHQPMQDERGNVLVFNGEIYNYREIKSKIAFRGRTNSDTEVLLHLYAEKGHDALPELNGMFAFAYYDASLNQLLLARDRAGKKPLYYSVSNGIFAFSSEIKALLTLPWIKAEVDNSAMYDFLTYNQLDAPRTMFRDIFKLAPGECMTVSTAGIVLKKNYWEVSYTDLSANSESDIADQLFEQLTKSVSYRLVSDVPVGAFLSGGVDSSAVVALMRSQSQGPIKTYSVGFEGQPDYDERSYALKVSRMFNTEHHEKIISASDIAEFLPKVVEIFDEPMADATAIPIYFISKLARENGTIVVQTGDGADELFAGYRGWKKYRQLYPWYHRVTAMPGFLRSGLSLLAGKNESPANEIIRRAAAGQEFFWGGAKAFKEGTKQQFLEQDWLAKVTGADSYEVIRRYRQAFTLLQQQFPWLGDTDWMCYLGVKFQIPSKYLYRMDRLGMANSIEIRSPFLDYNLINFGLSVPARYKVKGNEPKAILKKSLERILPHDILYRKKMGFVVPLREWSGEIMFDYIETNMKSFCANTGIFKEAALREHLQEIRNGNKDYTNNLWTIYFLMNWYNRWM